MNVRTSIIIVNWNSKDYVRECLRSLFAHHPYADIEVIVVDGASFDGCDRMLAEEFPSVTFVQSKENVGFARANNLGVRHASGDYLFFLNPDTLFLENSIALLTEHLEKLPRAGAVGCKLLNTDRTLQTSCVQSFPTLINQILDSEALRRLAPRSSLWGVAAFHSHDNKPVPVEAISGAAIMMKKSVFQTIKGFSENYFMYGEDIDLCYKTKQAGFEVYYIPATSIVHHGGGSTRTTVSNFANVTMRESILRFLRTNRGALSAALYRPAMAISALLRISLLLPSCVPARRASDSRRYSLRKWTAIFRWSLGLPHQAEQR